MDPHPLYVLVVTHSEALLRFYRRVSVALVDEGGQVGSAALVWAARRLFLATAAHVLGGAQAAVRAAADLSPQAATVPLRGAPVWTDPALDLAVMPLPARLARALGKQAVPLDLLAPRQGHFADDLAGVAGFPAALRAGEPDSGPLGPVILATRTRPADPELPVAGLDPERHLLLEYPRRGRWLPANQVGGLPEPAGMSGGGIWKLGLNEGSEWRPRRIRLVGIQTGWYRSHRLIKGVRIEHWLRLLAAQSPGLERAVRRQFPDL